MGSFLVRFHQVCQTIWGAFRCAQAVGCEDEFALGRSRPRVQENLARRIAIGVRFETDAVLTKWEVDIREVCHQPKGRGLVHSLGQDEINKRGRVSIDRFLHGLTKRNAGILWDGEMNRSLVPRERLIAQGSNVGTSLSCMTPSKFGTTRPPTNSFDVFRLERRRAAIYAQAGNPMHEQVMGLILLYLLQIQKAGICVDNDPDDEGDILGGVPCILRFK